MIDSLIDCLQKLTFFYAWQIDHQYLEERSVLEDHWLFRGTGILYYSDKAVPVLGWRKMDKRGKIDFKLPSLALAFHELPSCDTWIPPSLLPPKLDSPTNITAGYRHDSLGSFSPEFPSAPSPPARSMSEISPFVDSSGRRLAPALKTLISADRIPEEEPDHETDAEKRAHGAAVSLLGLRGEH